MLRHGSEISIGCAIQRHCGTPTRTPTCCTFLCFFRRFRKTPEDYKSAIVGSTRNGRQPAQMPQSANLSPLGPAGSEGHPPRPLPRPDPPGRFGCRCSWSGRALNAGRRAGSQTASLTCRVPTARIPMAKQRPVRAGRAPPARRVRPCCRNRGGRRSCGRPRRHALVSRDARLPSPRRPSFRSNS